VDGMTHCDIVLSKLKAGISLTAKDAIQFGCYRLAARVKDLRERGVHITTIKEKNANGSYHARYVLANSASH
jgi:hypothetical protein